MVKKPKYISYISQRNAWEAKGYALTEAMSEKEFQIAYQRQKIHNPNNILRNLVSKETVISKAQAKRIQKNIMQFKKTNPEVYKKLVKVFPNYKTQKGIRNASVFRTDLETRKEIISELVETGAVNIDIIDRPDAVSEAQQKFFDTWDELGSKELAEIVYGY